MPSWTPVALAPDLLPATAMPARTELGELAVWRGASGRVSAFHDRCPHRGMRLSHGFVRGEMLSCIYHGWRYDGAGQCRKIPAHPDLEPPAAIRAGAVACTELGGVIWVAPAGTETLPSDPGAVEPLRSLPVAARIKAVRSALSFEEMGTVSLPGLLSPLTIALQDAGEQTMLHVLIPASDPAGRIAASRALEILRRDIEATAKETAA
ncbi:Rieske (2Fe-2S) protein [Paracoccus sp. MBLB3053]|uniref:Rieske (2Fe-2S) protein n=1 Tax=Paracoccus aurantius TaxID=3073814 RepID=A0ABU2HS68_9RHOB|nr:Rieske (2Fe-2S) protein [Paracoccus sp. MBLB3053]MDS9467866.1 Rieske (2Fe-2S) protein [Paracoccus sp. MBLB3053]